jgi:precorrin-6A/cobalt-precorrin-6A reductase
MRILVLGGINEAVTLAKDLHQCDVRLIYSIAGLVRQPDLDCTVVSGGFSKIGGLEGYLKTEEITMVLDVTHPYASSMSQQAVDACAAVGIPCWRYLRPAWEQLEGDNWHEFDTWARLSHALFDHAAVFITAGRLDQTFVDDLYEWTRDTVQKQWVRSANKPGFNIPPSMTWIEDIGPYGFEGELALMNKFNIDAVISKNSGGNHAIAKLEAARERGIPVYMLKRPALPKVDREFDDVEECREALLQICRQSAVDAG